MIEIDTSELERLADDFTKTARVAAAATRGAVQGASAAVKESMREDMRDSRSFGQVASAITFETRTGADWAEGQVGPTRGSPGSLANIAYFGAARGGGGTVRDPQAAADEESPRFVRALEQIIEGLL